MNKQALKSELTGDEKSEKALLTRVTPTEYRAFLEKYNDRRLELLDTFSSFTVSDYLREIVFTHLDIDIYYPESASTAKV